jgi:cold shock protein
MAQGTVKWFNAAKGYGFITQDTGADVFVHYSSLEGGGLHALNEGERVEFDIVPGAKGPQAKSVRKPPPPAGNSLSLLCSSVLMGRGGISPASIQKNSGRLTQSQSFAFLDPTFRTHSSRK